MAQKALGRLFNSTPAADNVWINLQDAGGVSFLCFLTGGAGDTYTLTQAQDASGTGAKALTCITDYYTNTGNGSDSWTKRTQAVANTVVAAAAATQNAVAIEVLGVSLDDGFQFVRLASTGSGAVNAITSDLNVQRTPENLPAMATA
ncbi:hypothetical protein [Streptomyces niveus]|uniref:hypothetical protein n=1 Tax=Streptomyces niveus TaxID=193462 RepID=UPI00386FF717